MSGNPSLVDSAVWDAYGFILKFEWTRPSFSAIIDSVIVPDWKLATGLAPNVTFTVSGEPNSVRIERDGELLLAGITFESSVDNLRRCCQLHLATYCQRFLFLHAGVVKSPRGIILVPGKTFSGKSTLVKALLERGCLYYSDEYARIDSQGLVHPFPRPMRERTGPHTYRFTEAAALGWSPSEGPEKPHLVVFTSFHPQACWNPQPLTPGRALLELLKDTVVAQLEPEKSLAYLTQLLHHQPACQESSRGEAETTADLLLNLPR